jgi:dienelactone hydrolase
MENKTNSRRRFIKSSVAVAGVGIIGKSLGYNTDCPNDTIVAPGPIPLNDILIDYQQVQKKYALGLMKATICDKQSWESKRLSILRRAKMMLGEPPLVSGGPIEPDVLAEVQRKGYRELKIQFPSGTGDMVKGYLLIPDKAKESSPRPAIMALHSTGPGASQAVGLTPKENRCYGMDLAQRGYIVLAIDTIAAGERVYPGYDPYYTNEFYKEYPRWSAMDKMIYDHKKGLDYLCSLKLVDSSHLGCIGHSLGGYNSFFLQAFDSRIKAAVSSCGFNPMGQTNSPFHYARNDWFAHFPISFRDYIRAGMVPCDVHEIMALCAPRPFFNYSGRKDANYYKPAVKGDEDFTQWWHTVDQALSQVARIYEILGAKENFVRVETDGGHDFPPDVRERAYCWFDKLLGMY